MSEPRRTSSGTRAAGPVVLLVDDSADLREVFAHVLAQDGFVVVEAADGRDAVDKALRLVPDVIVMDLRLPVLDGVAAARLLKTHEQTSHVPVVALTGCAGDLDAVAGFDDVILKPCMPQTLPSRLRALVARAPARALRSP